MIPAGTFRRPVRSQLNPHTGGMMGAFGRRVVTTVGKNVYFFGKEWRQDQYFWTLPDSAKRALEDLKIV